MQIINIMPGYAATMFRNFNTTKATAEKMVDKPVTFASNPRNDVLSPLKGLSPDRPSLRKSSPFIGHSLDDDFQSVQFRYLEDI